ncbi:unnamed protein product [Colias eurytheme]|nr:unnamed protein product [Colias eurytheme]
MKLKQCFTRYSFCEYKMQSFILALLIILQTYQITTAPATHIQLINKIKPITRQKKAPNYPYHHHYLVPNLQVIPIHGHWNEQSNMTHYFVHNLVPIHELITVNQLSVIPLQKEHHTFHIHEDNIYRNPIGGYVSNETVCSD